MRVTDFSLSKRSKYFSAGYDIEVREAILTNSCMWGTQRRAIRAFLPKWKKVRRRKGLTELVLSRSMVPYTVATSHSNSIVPAMGAFSSIHKINMLNSTRAFTQTQILLTKLHIDWFYIITFHFLHLDLHLRINRRWMI